MMNKSWTICIILCDFPWIMIFCALCNSLSSRAEQISGSENNSLHFSIDRLLVTIMDPCSYFSVMILLRASKRWFEKGCKLQSSRMSRFGLMKYFIFFWIGLPVSQDCKLNCVTHRLYSNGHGLGQGCENKKDLAALSQQLAKLMIEPALNAEIDPHSYRWHAV